MSYNKGVFMFIFALLIGIYSYLIFALGLAGLLYKDLIIWFTLLFWGLVIYWFGKDLIKIIGQIRHIGQIKSKTLLFLILIVVLQAGINFIGALGPELAFDALWYHLTIPKMYLENHSIYFIPGGLLYYSGMPKLGEMLYIGGLAFGNEIIAKVIHFSFGLFTCFALYKIQRKFLSPLISMIGVVIFYSNPVVAWESITAYVDLIRTFFEVMALWAFVNWREDGKIKWFIWSALMAGLAITIKLLAVGSLIIFSILIIYYEAKRDASKIKIHNTYYIILNTFIRTFAYWLIALAVLLPWLMFSYINTGNPVYPFFSKIYKIVPEALSILGFFRDFWILFMRSADPISPVYMIFLPLIIWFFWCKRLRSSSISKFLNVVGIYSFISIVVWYFTPRTGGGRFILPYLPAFSIVCAATFNFLIGNKKKYGEQISKLLIILIIFVSFISIVYRFAANSKYIFVLSGRETKQMFLANHLNFAFGDFYDIDGYFKKNIKKEDKVLLIGFHNLYYVDFPFIDSSWLKAGDKFNLIATQNTVLSKKYEDLKLIYVNDKTMVKLYKRE